MSFFDKMSSFFGSSKKEQSYETDMLSGGSKKSKKKAKGNKGNTAPPPASSQPTIPSAPAPASAGESDSSYRKQRPATEEELAALAAERDRKLLALMIAEQIKEEDRMEAQGYFAKNQKCLYNDRIISADFWVECKIAVNAHLNDGLSNPYYTILFDREIVGEDGTVTVESMEKQTMPDRLKRVARDGENGSVQEKVESKEEEEDKTQAEAAGEPSEQTM